MNNYYFCLQGTSNPLFDLVWLNIFAANSEDAYEQAYAFYRSIFDRENDDLIDLCMMESPRANA